MGLLTDVEQRGRSGETVDGEVLQVGAETSGVGVADVTDSSVSGTGGWGVVSSSCMYSPAVKEGDEAVDLSVGSFVRPRGFATYHQGGLTKEP